MRRYDFGVEREMWGDIVSVKAVPIESINGQWVRFEDAAELQDRIDALESELEEIKRKS